MNIITDIYPLTADAAVPLSVPSLSTPFSLPIIPAPLVVTFTGHDGTQALFIVDKGTVTFEGNADAAALQFIDAVTRRHAEQWAALEQRALAAEAELGKYRHHNALMQLAHQLVAADRQLKDLRLKIAQLRGGRHSEQCIHCNQYISCSEQKEHALESRVYAPESSTAPGHLREVGREEGQ